MTVYVLVKSNFDGSEILGIYANRGQAEDMAIMHWRSRIGPFERGVGWHVEAHPLIPDNIL